MVTWPLLTCQLQSVTKAQADLSALKCCSAAAFAAQGTQPSAKSQPSALACAASWGIAKLVGNAPWDASWITDVRCTFRNHWRKLGKPSFAGQLAGARWPDHSA